VQLKKVQSVQLKKLHCYGKRPLGRPRRRWVGNIETDLKEIGWDGVDWIDLAQDKD
jgi:hypothetical protein